MTCYVFTVILVAVFRQHNFVEKNVRVVNLLIKDGPLLKRNGRRPKHYRQVDICTR